MANESVLQTLSIEFSAVIQRTYESTVVISGRRSFASGIVWQPNLIVTADHLLGRTSEFDIYTSSGEQLAAVVAGRDPSMDVAVLKTQKELKAIQAVNDAALKAGELALCVGRAMRGRLLATLSMISGTDGAYRNWRGGTFDQFIGVDKTPYPGFSGSALVLTDGKIAGMNTAAFSRHFGLTVPASNIERLVQRVASKGFFGKPYLGVMMQPVRLPDKWKQSGTEFGMLVAGTEQGSPAEDAGVQLGDVIVRFDGKNLNSMEEIHELLNDASIGKEIVVGILRGGSVLDLKLKIGERPFHQNK
jgi:S1-C subfamily serine protease